MAARTSVTDDRRVRYRKHYTGIVILWHPCETCGVLDASFGFEVGFKDKEHKGLGRWFCRDCKPNSNDKGEVM